MALENISDIFSEELAGIINAKDDWDEEDKRYIHGEMVKTFGEVWSEVVTTYNNSKGNPTNQCMKIPAKEGQLASSDETEETLEDVQIRHEATLTAVTKKRKEYPARLAALLGKTRRLQKNTSEVLKVDLPLKAPLEGDCKSHFDENLAGAYKATSDTLSKSCHDIQRINHRLTHIADAVEVIVNNQHHPTEALLTSTENL